MSSELTGIIERVTFHNPENGFCVLKVKVKGQRDLMNVVGNTALVSGGEWFEAQGEWINNKQFGKQFKADSIIVKQPTTNDGIEKFLGSGVIRGIREITARKIMAAFGKDVFTIFENEPERLRTEVGLPEIQANRIIKSWANHKAIKATIEYVAPLGLTPLQATRIHNKYKDQAITKIEENPYCLVDIQGINFETADRIAQTQGLDHDSPLRARAGIFYVLNEAVNDGHCGLPTEQAIAQAQKLLNVDQVILESAIKAEIKDKRIVKDELHAQECLFSAKHYLAEKDMAHRLHELLKGDVPWKRLNVAQATKDVAGKFKIELSKSQKEAFTLALKSTVMIITGGPGVGKTTLTRSLLKALTSCGTKILLGAPTGRAAKRLSEVTGYEAKTLHRLLEINPIERKFGRNHDNPLECDLLIIDEMSMVDIPLFYAVLKAIPKSAALFLVGDPDQLPSIGPGQILLDMIRSEILPSIHLTEIFRQAASSQIISFAHTLNQGQVPPLDGFSKDSDFFFIEESNAEETCAKIIDVTTRRLPEKMKLCPFADIQILSPMNRGPAGVTALNLELQKVLNPPTPKSLKHNGNQYSIGDKVMQIRNNYDKDVYNGDIGIVSAINNKDEEMVINFDGRKCTYDFSELNDIVLSYAITIHKSQGSEYKAVIIPLVTDHYIMLQKTLIYTAITRGKSLVVLVGDKRAIGMALNNKRAQQRWTMLGEQLKRI